VIRISPTPLYNTHSDVLRFARCTQEWRDVG
jgi:kynureninase